MNKEELEDEIKSLGGKRDRAYLDMNKYQKEIEDLMEGYYETTDTHTKVICIQCGGQDYVQTEEGKKQICPVCKGKKYIWLPKYKEEITK